ALFDRDHEAEREEHVMDNCFPFIHGVFDFPRKETVVFKNFVPLIEYPLVDAKPDFFDGANPATINPRVCRDLLINATKSFKDKVAWDPLSQRGGYPTELSAAIGNEVLNCALFRQCNE
ncbi:MAG: hypothetical protein M1826_004012, partial [Phylliscum demangeonii]